MKYKKGDRILFNRLMFGTVERDQTEDGSVNAMFDLYGAIVQTVRSDLVELVSDAHHEATLSELITGPPRSVRKDTAETLTGIADELDAGADSEKNIFRIRAIMKDASYRIRTIVKEM